MTPRRRRGLTDEERALWRNVTRSVAPLGRAKRKAEAEPEMIAPAPVAAPPVTVAAQPRAAKARPSPPLAPLDRRTSQRVARGSTEIDARIDLHGMTQERAHGALLRFLRRAQADEAKLVLVITGKGVRRDVSSAERGVLKRMVPEWLALENFRPYVVGFTDAHVTHGGTGALYVRVRRPR